MATLETELAELERIRKTIHDVPRAAKQSPRPPGPSASDDAELFPRDAPSIDDALSEMKRRAGGAAAAPKAAAPKAAAPGRRPAAKGSSVEDELAALKRKMQSAPPKKK